MFRYSFTYTLALWVNEGARKHVVRWSIGTVEVKEHCIYIPAANFDENLFYFTYPSSRRNIETSNGYEHFTLDRDSDIIKLHNFYVGYVQFFSLIILKQIWNNLITDQPLISHVKMNGRYIFVKYGGANNDKSL